MFKRILVLVAVLVAVVLAYTAFQPNTYSVTRTSQPIKATPAEVFAQIQDFHNWGQWSPWHQLDPNMKQTYDGPLNGTGAVYSWESPQEGVGSGRMEILAVTAPSDVKIKLDFLQPMTSSAITDFKIAQTESGGAQVTWTLSGDADFMTKMMSGLGLLDDMIGKDFEKGLAQLKTVTEGK